MTSEVAAAYASRASEYAEHLGSMTAVHPADVNLVSSWATEVGGPIVARRRRP